MMSAAIPMMMYDMMISFCFVLLYRSDLLSGEKHNECPYDNNKRENAIDIPHIFDILCVRKHSFAIDQVYDHVCCQCQAADRHDRYCNV